MQKYAKYVSMKVMQNMQKYVFPTLLMDSRASSSLVECCLRSSESGAAPPAAIGDGLQPLAIIAAQARARPGPLALGPWRVVWQQWFLKRNRIHVSLRHSARIRTSNWVVHHRSHISGSLHVMVVQIWFSRI